jgi:hypothetical protein
MRCRPGSRTPGEWNECPSECESSAVQIVTDDAHCRVYNPFYALVGGLFWVVSFDLQRYRQVVIYLGAAITILGAAFAVIDWAEGLPLFWKVWEGPFVIALGLSLFFLGRALEQSDSAS